MSKRIGLSTISLLVAYCVCVIGLIFSGPAVKKTKAQQMPKCYLTTADKYITYFSEYKNVGGTRILFY